MADVLTYPLSVVADSAVITELTCSSPFVTAGRLTSPALIKANVHGLCFMFF